MTYKKYLEVKPLIDYYLKGKEKFSLEDYENMSNLIGESYSEYYIYRKHIEKAGFTYVETYKNNEIFQLDGKYIPYIGCHYYFEILEDCKARIDTLVAMPPM